MRDRFILLVGALFAIPFILFSASGGYLADRHSKRAVTIGTKIFEIGVGLFAIAALALANLPMEAVSVFLISTQGALFGPSKYGLLPELLPENKLSWGKRNSGTRHVSRFDHRGDVRGIPGRRIPRAPGLVPEWFFSASQ